MPVTTPQGTLDFKKVDRVTFVGASSNTVIDTTTGSLGVGVDGNGPTSNLHVVGDALITGNVSDLNVVSNVNMLHTANTASIKLNSNVVAEFPRSKKLIKYPRVAMTANSSGGYVASAHSEYPDGTNYHAFRTFNNRGVNVPYVVGVGWESANTNTFGDDGLWGGSNASGAPTSSSANTTMTLEEGNTIYGEWLQIQLPTKIRLEYVNFLILSGSPHAMAHRAPRAGYVLGSNNGTNWTTLKNWSGIVYDTWTAYYDKFYKFDIDKEVDNYQYFRFVWTETASGSGNALSRYASCQELEFWGVPEYDPEAHGTDVTVKSYPNVPNTDWLEVYYDAKGLATGAVTTVNDLKPSSLGSALNSSSTNNITVADDAFVFNGTDSYIKINDLTNPLGAWVHSVVAWVKFTDFDSSCEVSWIGDGDGASIRQSFSFQAGGETVTMGISASNVQFRFTSPLTAGKWHHVVYTYNGGQAGSASTAYQVFIDGVEAQQFSGTGTGTLTLPAGSALWFGRNHSGANHFGGSIANFRIFNRVLTTDEIYQLYAYQKEDFGHSTNNMTLKAGRLGIGTSEPRAALDVRGDVKFSGMPNMTESIFFYIGGSAGDKYPIYQNTHEYYQNKFIPPGIGSYGVDTQWYTTSSYAQSNDLFKSHFDTMVYWLKNAPIGHVHKLNWVTDGTSCNGTTFGQKNNGTQIRLWGYFPAYNTGYSYGNNKQWNDALIFNMSSATELLIFYDGYTISN